MRPLQLAVGLALVGAGLGMAPRLHRGGSVAAGKVPSIGRQVRTSEARRWVRVDVPPETGLDELLARYRMASRTYVCRQECRGASLSPAQCRGLSGRVWVAAGDPPPAEGPSCEDGR